MPDVPNLFPKQPPTSELPDDIQQRFARTRMLLLDVDGVMTDGTITLDDNGMESKRFSVRDGLGLIRCRRFGLKTGVISGRASEATLNRCKDLQMDEIHLGYPEKLPVFEEIYRRYDLLPEEIAFMGDDVLDLSILQQVGLATCPADAHREIRQKVHFVSRFPGGHGAVRELIDHWLQATGHYEEFLRYRHQPTAK
jgi:3-deoxy-D-manno-octulosonate 8-phosphate phosphatase (KDO 8-P phosphatase)